jgi:hypothetical protein
MPATAQTEAPTQTETQTAPGDPRFYGGARYSFSLSDVSALQEYDPRFGVGGGIFVAGHAWHSLDLRVEANYVQKGAHLAVSRSEIEWQLDFLEVPVLLVWNTSPQTQTSVQFYAGVSYAIPLQRQIEQGENIGYDIEDFVDQGIVMNSTTVVALNGVEDADLGLALGVGLSVPVGAVNFLVEARYTRSFTDPYVSADFVVTTGQGAEAVTETTVADFSNRVFTFYFGFSFPFGARSASESQ